MPDIDLPYEDGEPLESHWHRRQINLLGDMLHRHWHERTDFFAGGNMFVYYSLEQARTRDYKGPDFFVVLGVDGTRPRLVVGWNFAALARYTGRPLSRHFDELAALFYPAWDACANRGRGCREPTHSCGN